MLLPRLALPLFISTLVQAAAIPLPATNMASVTSGYKNVAYFVNWVCSLTTNPQKPTRPSNIVLGHLRTQLQPSGSPG